MFELPVMNTPQFEWARTRMVEEPEPMSRIYPPKASVGSGVSGSADTSDRILGRTLKNDDYCRQYGRAGAYGSVPTRSAIRWKETGAPVSPDRRDNLFVPVTDFHGMCGPFGTHAKPRTFRANGEAMRSVIIGVGAALCFVMGRSSPNLLGAARGGRRRTRMRTNRAHGGTSFSYIRVDSVIII